jgi:2-methylcitrate dehydratase
MIVQDFVGTEGKRVDKITEQLVTYTSGFSDAVITQSVREAMRRHLMDTVACAIAGYDLPAPRAARIVANAIPDQHGATLFGDGTKVFPEMAAFANATAVRSTEWNDGMLAMGGGHASDMIPAIVGIGEVLGSSPQEVFTAMVLAYELLGALGNTFYRRKMNWGIGTNVCPSAALAIAKLMGLDDQQLAWTTAHSVLTVPLGADHGHGTIVKGASVAKVLRTAIFSANLAKAGMAATARPYEGLGGVFDKVSGAPFELTLPAMPGGPMVVETSYLKRYPTEAHSQALLGFVIDKVRKWTTADELDSFDIETYWHAKDSLGRPDKGAWDPQTREMADHSMPYLLSVALVDGKLSYRSSFTPERVADPALRPLMAKISIREDEAITANYRPPGMEIIGNPLYRVRLRKRSGEEMNEDVTFPKGHYHNPMTIEDVDAKLDDACDGVIGDAQKEEIREAWWGFDTASDLRPIIATLATFR